MQEVEPVLEEGWLQQVRLSEAEWRWPTAGPAVSSAEVGPAVGAVEVGRRAGPACAHVWCIPSHS